MSPASGLDRRAEARRGRIVLGVMALVVAALGVYALTSDGGDDDRTEAVAGSDATTTAPPTVSEASGDDATTSTPGTDTTASTVAPATDPTTTAASVPAGGECTGDAATAAIATWPLRRRLASLVMVDPLSEANARSVVSDEHIGGIFIGGSSTDLLSSGVVADLVAAEAGGTGLMVSIDEEGGRVQRIDDLVGAIPSAREMAEMTPEEVRAIARSHAEAMAALGINVDLAPVVDLTATDEAPIGDRSFSDDPQTAATYAGAFANGLLDGGVKPVLKHFPGHGSASGDTHEGAARTPPLSELESDDLVPYQLLLGELGTRTAVMLGHLDVPGLTTDGVPASLSPEAVSYLRDRYGFGGVIMTDDLALMAAVTDRYTNVRAATIALAAGVDMVLFADVDVPGLLDGLEDAVGSGELDEATVNAAVARTMAYKGIDPCTDAV